MIPNQQQAHSVRQHVCRAEPKILTSDDGKVTKELQRASTLQSQTSLAALLQSQSSEQIASAVHDSHKVSNCQRAKFIGFHFCAYKLS